MVKESDRPSIMVYVDENFKDSRILQDILYGIEEESVFFHTKNVNGDSSANMAARAALESRLQVGIGLDSTGSIALHYKNMKDPLFLIRANREKAERSLGSNAARLVKGIPLIPVLC